MSNPVVSVVVPAYNRANTIARSIESVLAQTYRPLEIIVVDDGSTDQTGEIVESYGSQVTLLRQINSGPSSARNTGARHAKGDIISFLDSDDAWKPDKIERQVKLMLRGGVQVPCCICNALLIEQDGTTSDSFAVSGVDGKLAEGYWLNPQSIIATRFVLFNQVVAIRRESFDTVGGFNESMRLLEDHDLALRLSFLGPWAFVAEPLVEKYNDASGIGVLAMRDPGVHATAWANVLKSFLNEPSVSGSDAEKWIRWNLKNVRLELHAVNLMGQGSRIATKLGCLLMFWLRTRGWIRRRLPSWPRVLAAESIASSEIKPAIRSSAVPVA